MLQTSTPFEMKDMLEVSKVKKIIAATQTSEMLIEKYKDHRIEFIMLPLIFREGINILAAERGTGKTRMALSICFSMAYALPEFLGYPISHHGNTLYLNFELQEPEFKLFVEQVENHFKSKGQKKFDIHSISFKTHRDLKIDDIADAIKEFKPVLVVIDSFKAFSSKLLGERKERELNNNTVNAIYDVFSDWNGIHKTTILITNHTNKGTKNNRSHSDLMYGPSALMDYADHTTLLRKTNVPNQRLIVPDKCRFMEEGSSVTNLIEIVSSEDGGKIWFELVKDDVSESDYMYNDAKEIKYSEMDKQAVIELHKQEKSIRDIAKETNCPKSTVARWIKEYKEGLFK